MRFSACFLALGAMVSLTAATPQADPDTQVLVYSDLGFQGTSTAIPIDGACHDVEETVQSLWVPEDQGILCYGYLESNCGDEPFIEVWEPSDDLFFEPPLGFICTYE
ncbi:hypothetical protein BDV39DRAFT_203001 [Aspergillus sergii]|uniref:Beta/gamma crystallin 'Greek key' domain-containing protein n=1 Tax=Aspergillus sergii TaxID=1034303 RepID=A0A5N6X808_9EURO|nr:hypothetical protein BDV39DRAFT_203001 [Aspergillus sergii]